QDTGATFIIAHHMRKTGAIASSAITTPEQARAAVLGATGIVDGARAVYAMWTVPKEQARKVLKACGREIVGESWRGKVIQGAVVKGNQSPDRSTVTYIRNDAGLLIDNSLPLVREAIEQEEPMQDAFCAAVKHAAEHGFFFTTTSKITGPIHNP